ncbi:unnamed protein product [Durusdinium trenchii]|uniref:Uncharacterized protein n=1 Tax=Durusdinium trenchii TaxID=1381693 RepID=A0ABP0SC47_9DINO
MWEDGLNMFKPCAIRIGIVICAPLFKAVLTCTTRRTSILFILLLNLALLTFKKVQMPEFHLLWVFPGTVEHSEMSLGKEEVHVGLDFGSLLFQILCILWAWILVCTAMYCEVI